MKKKQVTLLELAKRLNLSPSTVSRALNDRHRISEETRKRVKDLAAALEYQPNPSAKSLRESKTYILGVLVPEIAHHFFSTAISGIEDIALEAGYNIMICQSHESAEREKAVADALLGSRVDGLLFCPSRETQEFDHFNSFLRKDIPIVFFDRISTEFDGSKVVVSDYEGALKAVDYLISSGCKRIAHLAGPAPLSNSMDRLNGYVKSLKNHGIPIDNELILHCELDHISAPENTMKLLHQNPRPDAIFCFNYHVAYDAMAVLKKEGVRIPEDISLIGFGEEPSCTLVEPTLSTVAQPAYQLGKVAANMMLEQLKMEGKDVEPEYQTITLPTELILRNSTRRVR